jgi:hypothetical protein
VKKKARLRLVLLWSWWQPLWHSLLSSLATPQACQIDSIWYKLLPIHLELQGLFIAWSTSLSSPITDTVTYLPPYPWSWYVSLQGFGILQSHSDSLDANLCQFGFQSSLWLEWKLGCASLSIDPALVFDMITFFSFGLALQGLQEVQYKLLSSYASVSHPPPWSSGSVALSRVGAQKFWVQDSARIHFGSEDCPTGMCLSWVVSKSLRLQGVISYLARCNSSFLWICACTKRQLLLVVNAPSAPTLTSPVQHSLNSLSP